MHTPLKGPRDNDRRVPCGLETKPTDEEAQAAGFSYGQEWYAYSAGGALEDPKVASSNFSTLPGQLEEPSTDMSAAQTYQFYAGQGDFFDTDQEPEVDLTAIVSQQLGIEHPYLLIDVEPAS